MGVGVSWAYQSEGVDDQVAEYLEGARGESPFWGTVQTLEGGRQAEGVGLSSVEVLFQPSAAAVLPAGAQGEVREGGQGGPERPGRKRVKE